MKNLLFIFLMLSVTSNVSAQNSELISKIGFRPVDPINYVYPIGIYANSMRYYSALIQNRPLEELNKLATKQDTCFVRENRSIFFSDIKKDKVVDLLPNETVEVQISEVTKEGGLTLKGTAAISSKNTSYQITMDYVKFVTVNVADTLNFGPDIQKNSYSIFSYARVGVGLRLVASIQTKRKGINLGDLFAIGFAASRNQISGSLSVNVLGVESQEITSLLPMPSEISTSSIQNAMQAMATIKSKIYNSDVELRPQIISIRSVNPKITTNDLVFNTAKILALGRTSNILSTRNEVIKYADHLIKCD